MEGKYEYIKFTHDPHIMPKKLYPSEPRSHAEIRDTSLELSGEDL